MEDDKMLTEREVAEMLGVTQTTLQRWRRDGGGPPWHKLQRLIRYRLSEVEKYIDERKHN